MKRISLTIATVLTAFCSFAQNSSLNTTVAGCGASGDNFSYGGYTVAHYGLGWYQEPIGSATAYLSGYMGIKFFTNSNAHAFLDFNGNLGIGTITPAGRLNIVEQTNGFGGQTIIDDNGNYIPTIAQYKWTGTERATIKTLLPTVQAAKVVWIFS